MARAHLYPTSVLPRSLDPMPSSGTLNSEVLAHLPSDGHKKALPVKESPGELKDKEKEEAKRGSCDFPWELIIR